MKFLPSNIDKDNVMLVDMLYHRPRKETNKKDALDIVYKDLTNGEKHILTIENPEINIYFVREEYRNYTHNKAFMEIDKCDEHRVQYKNIIWYIANQAGPEYAGELKRMLEMRDMKSLQLMHTYPYVFGSDIPIDTFYRANWLLEYDNEAQKPLTKLFFDIEVDTINIVGFPKNGECPINAITVVDDIENSVYTFLLNEPSNPQIAEFTGNIDSIIEELHDDFDESYGVLDYKVFMYDDEKDLIRDTFILINTLKRDVALAWNGMGFDIPYLIARMETLNMVPEDIMCHPDFKYKTCRFIPDTRNFEVANKGDCLKLSSYTKYLDQMILYAATRKGQSELRSNALTYIGKVELNDEKLDYSDEANIKTLPYVNYKKFYKYNVKDVLLQLGIERKVSDVDNLYLRAYSNCTDFDKVFKQTVMLKSRAYYEYLLQGIILGNNVNIFNKESDSGFTGALIN